VFSKYYQSELSYLRELGKEFAAHNPTLAGTFADRGGDPDVERLLEGFAFLTARIRERVDDAVPEVIEGLCQLVLPHYIRSIPSCSIVQFSPQPNALRGRHTVPAGTELGAKSVGGTGCLFRTTAPLDLLPLSLTATALDETTEAFPEIRLSFQAPEAGRLAVFRPEGFRLFLHGPLGVTSTVFLWFARYLREVTYRNADGTTIPLGKDSIRFAGLEDDLPLLPWPRLSPDGVRLLQEYFTLPQKLLFMEVKGLDRLDPEAGQDRFDLLFRFERPPKLPERIDRDMFRIHCVPVVNLFDVSADPIPFDARMHEYLVRAAGVNPLHAEVYTVNGVVGLRGSRGGRIEYGPYVDFAHAEQKEPAFYTVRRAASPIDNGIDTYLSVLTPRDVTPEFRDETLSIELTCTNRLLTAELRVSDISAPTPRSPTIARFQNITEVTKPTRPPLGSELQWRLLSHLSLNHLSLGDARALRALVHLYNFFEEADKQVGRANFLRGESVRRVDMKPATRLMSQVPVRGMRSVIEIEEASFASEGDAFLFGCTLDRLLGSLTPVNSFHHLSLRLHPSAAELTWQPRNGNLPIM
jgi:type VI secretion system protein ImpG